MAVYYGPRIEVIEARRDPSYEVWVAPPFPGFFEHDCRCPSPEVHNLNVERKLADHMRAHGLKLADTFKHRAKAEAYARSVRAAAFGVLKLKKKKA